MAQLLEDAAANSLQKAVYAIVERNTVLGKLSRGEEGSARRASPGRIANYMKTGVPSYSDIVFQSHFRMEKATAQKLKNDKVNLEEVDPETSEEKNSSDDASSVEEMDEIMTISDNEKSDCESNISEESCTSQKLKSASSCSSLTVHVCTYEGCNKFFSRPSRLAQHIRTHTGERPFVCPSESCARSYSRQQHLKRHIEISHQDRETTEKLKCVMCDKMMSNIYALRKHMHRFHSCRRHECSECGQSFIKPQQLQKHTYVHTGIKPFLCDYPECEMRCMNLSVLRRHKMIHQKSRYGCPKESCQQKFDTYKDQQHHIKADHPKDNEKRGRQRKRKKHLTLVSINKDKV